MAEILSTVLAPIDGNYMDTCAYDCASTNAFGYAAHRGARPGGQGRTDVCLSVFVHSPGTQCYADERHLDDYHNSYSHFVYYDTLGIHIGYDADDIHHGRRDAHAPCEASWESTPAASTTSSSPSRIGHRLDGGYDVYPAARLGIHISSVELCTHKRWLVLTTDPMLDAVMAQALFACNRKKSS